MLPLKHLYALVLCIATISSSGQPPAFQSVFGDSILEKPLSISQISSGNIYISGFAQSDSIGGVDFSLSKLDISGNHLWTRYLGTTYDDYLSYADLTLDSTRFVMAGSSNNAAGDSDGAIIISDTLGNELISTTSGFPGVNDVFNFVQCTADSGFIACGFTAGLSGVGLDYYVVKFDSTGTEEWSKIYGGGDNDYAQSIRQTSDGGYILVGDSKSFNANGNYDIWAIRLNTQGDSIWSTLLGAPTHVNGSQDIIVLGDSNYLIVGESTIPPASGFEFTMFKVDDNGSELWSSIFGGPGTDALFSAVETLSGDFLITGYSNSNSNGIGPVDIVVLATDDQGNEIGREYFGGGSIDIGYDLQPAQNGNYLVTGMYRNTNDDYFAMEIGWNDVVGIVEHLSPEQVFAYPNPAKDFIKIPEFSGESVRIYDAEGRLVHSIRAGASGELILNQIRPGFYLVKCGNRSTRFIKTN